MQLILKLSKYELDQLCQVLEEELDRLGQEYADNSEACKNILEQLK